MKRKFLSLFLIACMAVLMTVPLSAATEKIVNDISWYSDSATEMNISDGADLLGFVSLIAEGKNFSGKTVNITADIDLNPGWTAGATAPANIWPDTSGGKFFCGTINGNGHTISGIHATLKTSNAAGLFGLGGSVVTDKITVKNLRIVNSYMTSSVWQPGLLFGTIGGNCTIQNVYSDATVVTTKADGTGLNITGGLVGQVNNNASLTMTSCVFAGTITRPSSSQMRGMGGLVGMAFGNLAMTDCAFYGTINNPNDITGGLVGRTENATTVLKMENCISAGTINANENATTGYFLGQVFNNNPAANISIKNSLYAVTGSTTYNVLPDGYNFTGKKVTVDDLTGSAFITWLENNSAMTGFDDWKVQTGEMVMPAALAKADTPTPGTTTAPSSTTPPTGDYTPMIIFGMIALAAALAIALRKKMTNVA